jgi:hypothetical protein
MEDNKTRMAMFKASTLNADDQTAAKLSKVWDQLESFIREDLNDGFQLRDIYSLIVAVMNGLEVYFSADSGYTLKKYALFLVDRIIEELVTGGIIPSEISMLVKLVPVGTVVDLVKIGSAATGSNMLLPAKYLGRAVSVVVSRHPAGSESAESRQIRALENAEPIVRGGHPQMKLTVPLEKI